MGLKDRLILITKELKLSGRAFEKECGLTTGAFAGFKERIGADILSKIIIRYPQFSARWILTGEGDMFSNDYSNSDVAIKILQKKIEELNAQYIEISQEAFAISRENRQLNNENRQLRQMLAEEQAARHTPELRTSELTSSDAQKKIGKRSADQHINASTLSAADNV